jgi:hypothetical protein
MVRFILFALGMLLLISCSEKQVMDEWWKGKDLRETTLREWSAALPKDKLATAGTIVSAVDSTIDLNSPADVSRLKDMSSELVVCMDKVAGEKRHRSLKLNTMDVATGCVMVMGYGTK